MKNTITVKKKNVYGTDLIYPICANALTFATLIGKKTLSESDLKHIQTLDFKVYFV